MIWTAWNSGRPLGADGIHGLKVSYEDRKAHFKKSWKTVKIELPKGRRYMTVEANVGKKSFWNPGCAELVNINIARWLEEEGLAPWRKGHSPKFNVEIVGPRLFRVGGSYLSEAEVPPDCLERSDPGRPKAKFNSTAAQRRFR